MMIHNAVRKGVSICPFLCFSVLLTVLTACREDSELDAELQHPGAQIGAAFTDTFSIYMRTVRIDSVRTDQNFRMPLGEYYDPVFGLSRAALATQFQLSIPGVNFNDPDLEFDSLVLALAYGSAGSGSGSFYSRKTGTGNIDLDEQTFRVYPLKETFTLSDTVFSDGTVRNGFVKGKIEYDKNQPVGEAINITPKVGSSDSIIIGDESFAPHLRIRLDQAFGQNLFSAGQGVYAAQQSFVDHFPGLAVVPENNYAPGRGQILYIDPGSPSTRMIMYYRNTSGSEDVQETYEFSINDEVGRFNYFEKNYTGTKVQTALNAPFPNNYFAGGENEVYVQGMAGTRAEIHIPHLLKAFDPEKDYVINEAELILPRVPAGSDPFRPIPQFNIAAKTESGSLTVVADFVEGFGHMDGYIDEATGNYRFNITRHLQRLIRLQKEGIDDNFGFVIVPASEPITAERSILRGFDPQSGAKPKFNITFTPLND